MASQDKAATFSVVAKDAASSVLRGVGKEMGKLGKTGGAVFKTLAATAAIAAAAITTAFGLSAKFAKSAIEAAISDDAEQQKLIATLKARGLTTEEATKRTNELIAAGQKLAFTDSETRAGLGIASQYTKNYAKQTAILTAAQNLSRARNISLEAATKLVGKAFAGNGKALKAYGIDLTKTGTVTTRVQKITKDGAFWETQTKQITGTVKGLEAVNLISKKNAGVAKAYADTFAGQFQRVRDSINETVEAIGGAIGGGEGLPTFKRLLEGIQPVVDDLVGEINKNLPNIEKFSRELVEKFLAKLPGYVATAKRELPILIKKAKDFIGGVAGFAKDIASFLGPDGLITAGIAGVGFKMGGLAGGIGAVFAEQFIKNGVDPITASIIGTLGGAVSAGLVQGIAKAGTDAAIAKFIGLFRNIPISPSLPGGTVPTGGPGMLGTALGVAGVAVSIVAVTTAAAAALSNAITGSGMTNKVGGNNVIDIFGTTAATLADNSKDQGKVLSDLFTFITTGQRPIEVQNNLKVELDGKVVAGSVSTYLAQQATNLSPQRTFPRAK